MATPVRALMTHPSPSPCRAGAKPLDDVKNSLKVCMVRISLVAQYVRRLLPLRYWK
ncbi:MAG: hypothetical protein OXE49_22210 [Gemmatimonadetes bacterium]|nr:hypothetical protein [Gemmatimonadota bacterium]